MEDVRKIKFLSQEESNPPKCIELGIDLKFECEICHFSDQLLNNQIKHVLESSDKLKLNIILTN